MFQIGDKIVYPMHGAGIIVDIEEQKILGEVHKYYIMKMPVNCMKVMLPVNNAESIGIRGIADETVADSVINHFIECEDTSSDNWNQRYRENIEKIKSGELMEVATVAKTLMLRDKRKSLSNAERKIMTNAKNILISELVLIKEKSYEEIMELLLLEA